MSELLRDLLSPAGVTVLLVVIIIAVLGLLIAVFVRFRPRRYRKLPRMKSRPDTGVFEKKRSWRRRRGKWKRRIGRAVS